MSSSKSLKRPITLTVKVLVAMFCSLAIWEFILENTVSKSPGFTSHSILGRINKPGVAVQGQEGFSSTKVNSLGMRGDEIRPKANNEYRILALGDSFTRAVHVPDNQTYTHLLQEQLKSEHQNLSLQTINAGKDGASPAYYIHNANFFNSLSPDTVVIQLTDQDFTDDMLNEQMQFHVVQEQNNFKTVYIENFYSDNALSRLFQEKFPKLSFMLEYSVLRVGGENVRKALASKGNSTGTASAIAQDKPDTKNYEPLIDWTISNLKAKYPNLVIFYIPFIDYDNPQKSPSDIENLLPKIASKYNVDFVGMRDIFLDYYRTYRQPAYGFNNTVPGTGHINEIGHKLSAESLALVLEKRIAK